MAERNEVVYLEDIINAIDRTSEYLEGVSEVEFQEMEEKQDGLYRFEGLVK